MSRRRVDGRCALEEGCAHAHVRRIYVQHVIDAHERVCKTTDESDTRRLQLVRAYLTASTRRCLA